jgi:hypothetical protein
MLKNTINSINNFITGEKFYACADMIYSPDIKPEFDDYNVQINTFDKEKLKDLNTIYTHTLYVKYLFDEIKDLPNKFIIITHNSDINIDYSFHIPNNVIKWYAQNANIIDTRVISLPIGLENERWFQGVNKKQKMIDKLATEKKIKNLVYMNHSVATYPSEREPLYKKFSNYTYITTERGINGQNYDRYVDNIYNHNFVICPRGNGIDTHRLWECLYLNTIPIVRRENYLTQFKDLPILIIDDWCDITRKYILTQELNKFHKLNWNYDKLKFSYWRNRIAREKDLHSNDILQQEKVIN